MTEQPISLTEAKAFLRLEYTDEDKYIESLIKTAREMCESYMRKQIDTANCPHGGQINSEPCRKCRMK